MNKVLIWDLPLRVFHWSLVINFFMAYLTSESERWALIHLVSGYNVLGLILFRVLWGVVGSRYARFKQFLPTPRQLLAYLYTFQQTAKKSYPGHNPLGTVGIIMILLLGLMTSTTGIFIYYEIDTPFGEESHEVIANIMIGFVLLHIAGVLVTSWIHKENLILSMIHGKKNADPMDGIQSSNPMIALLLLLAVIGSWLGLFLNLY
jgi:cytochrome b